MASITYNPIVSNIRGSVGNATFQRGQAGYIIRHKPFSSKSPSSSQSLHRNLILQIHNEWHSLTPEQVSRWNNFSSYYKTFANKNPSVLISGYALFLKHNFLLLCAGNAMLLSIVYNQNIFANPSGSSYMGAGTFGYDLDDAFNQTSWVVLLKVTPPLPFRTATPQKYFRVIIPTVISSFQLEIYTQYLSLFGRMPTHNEFVYFSIQFVNKKMPISQAPFICEQVPFP
jgi:hypothetical protein